MNARKILIFCGLAAVAMSPSATAAPGIASRERAFFGSVSGSWKGAGEVVAGKYKGTKFNCELAGESMGDAQIGIKFDGSCRVGIFKQPMSAVISKSGSSYKGKVLDGAAGKGLDVVSGAVTEDTVVFGLNRAKLNGAMIARVRDNKTMNVTVSVKVEDRMIPIIGLTLTREVDNIAVGSIE